MLKIILVDDEEIIRNSIKMMIPWNDLGCSVVGLAKNGVEAYQLVLDYYPDIILSDISMPLMDGLTLIEKVSSLSIETEFIVLSGYSEFSFAQKAMKFGVRHYLLKPTKKEDLIAVLSEVVEAIMIRNEQRRNESLKSIRRFGFYAQKAMLLEMLNKQTNKSDVLLKNMSSLGLKSSDTACIIGLETCENEHRLTVMTLLGFCKTSSLELLFEPVK